MKTLISLILLASCGLCLAGSGGPDVFGYTWTDSDAHPSVAPEIQFATSGTATEILADGDPDPGVVIDLDPPVIFYGGCFDKLMVSKNGYVTFEETDTGGDATNDCPFPAVPNKDDVQRIAVLHDNLDFGGGDVLRGRILHEYFPADAHPHHGCGAHVVTWKNMVHAGSATRFDFQLLLFDNFDIMMQFGANPENGSGSSTGLQRRVSGGVVQGLKVACDFAGGVPDDYALLFEPPTITVDSLSDDPIDPSGTNLREALYAAIGGEKIVFDAALAGGVIERDPAQPLLGTTQLRVVSIDASALEGGVAIDGLSAAPLFKWRAAGHCSNVYFRNGRRDPNAADDSIGGVAVNGGEAVTFSRCYFSRNISHAGGGLRVGEEAKVWLSACSFVGNETDGSHGGGVRLLDDSFLRAVACDFLFNEALGQFGGAVRGESGATLRLERCEMSFNRARLIGAVSAFDSDAEITDCLFANNTSDQDAGVVQFNHCSNIEVVGCTFSGNLADGVGVLAFVGGVPANVEFCTFVANSHAAIHATDGTVALVRNSLFNDNVALNGVANLFSGAGSVVSEGYNIFDSAAPLLLSDPTDLIGVDPLTGPLASNGGPTRTHALVSGSPAIDAGGASGAGDPAADQRGYDREAGAAMDIGAYEFQGDLVVTTAIDEIADPGDGLSLREAIRDAAPGTAITFDVALAGETISLSTFNSGQGFSLSIAKDLTVDASALPGGIAIDGFGAMRVMRVENGASVSLSGMTLQNGSIGDSDPFGGGGGMVVRGNSDVTLTGCAVRGCTSGAPGGGISVELLSSLVVESSTIAGNASTGTTTDGGGIHTKGDLSVRGSLVDSNESGDDGGGVFVEFGTLNIRRSTFARNSAADDGAAMALANPSGGELSQVTVSGNSAGGAGSVYIDDSPVEIAHCTIALNRAGSSSGGVFVAGFSPPQIGHTIFAANQVANIRSFEQDGEPASLGYNLLDDNSWTNQVATDMEERVAYLAPLADNGGDVQTHATLAISPAINGGDASLAIAPARDARGFFRIAEGRIDIGAHEAMAPVRVATLDDDLDGVAPRSLRDALLDVTEGGRIVFTQALNGGTIDLSTAGGGQGSRLVIERKVQIDASRLSDGITISGGDETGVFDLLSGRSAGLHAVSIKDGFGGASQDGGAVRLGGGAELLLTNGSLTGNRARNGGAIHAKGGAAVRLQNVTVSGNTAQLEGGALGLEDAATSALIEHCTITENDSNTGSIGGIDVGPAKIRFYSSVIAANSGQSVGLSASNTFTSLGYNINDDPGAAIGGQFSAAGDQNFTAPALNSLSNTGGWALVHGNSGSPALNAGDPDALLLNPMDARGFLRVVNGMDIGSFEKSGAARDSDSDGMPDYWENLFGFDPDDAGDAGENPDLDNDTNLAEFIAGTNPLVSNGVAIPDPEIVSFSRIGPLVEIVFTSAPGIVYEVQASNDLVVWFTFGSTTGAEGAETAFSSSPNLERDPERFYRVLLPEVE